MLFGLHQAGDERVAGWIRSDPSAAEPAVVAVLEGTRRRTVATTDVPPPLAVSSPRPSDARWFVICYTRSLLKL